MPDNPNQPEPPAAGDLPPEQPAAGESPPEPAPAEQTTADETVVMAQEPPAREPRKPGRFRQAASHRATPIVAAALAGVLVGGGVMALIAYTGDDRDDRRIHGETFRGEMFRGDRDDFFGDRDDFFERGPMRPEIHPWRGDMRERMQDRFRQMPIPDHRHDEDGNVIPAPQPAQPDQPEREPDQDGGN